MKIIKELQNNFTIVDNRVFQDTSLSLQAKGLYCLMISLPEDWNFSITGLAQLSLKGKHSTSTALKELEKKGLVVRKKYQDEGGHFDTAYYLYDYSTKINTVSENPSTGNPTTENQTNNKELINKELINKSLTKVKHQPKNTPLSGKRVARKQMTDEERLKVEIIFELFKEFNLELPKMFWNNKTQRNASLELYSVKKPENVRKALTFASETYKSLPNNEKRYFPKFDTPYNLLNNYNALRLKKSELND